MWAVRAPRVGAPLDRAAVHLLLDVVAVPVWVWPVPARRPRGRRVRRVLAAVVVAALTVIVRAIGAWDDLTMQEDDPWT